MTFKQEQNRARMMNQQNKARWLQRHVESGDITSHDQLAQVAAKIYASSKVLFMVQDYFGASLPTKEQ